MTLDDVSCLLYLSIKDCLLDHNEKLRKEARVELIIDLICVDLKEEDV